MSGVLNSGPNPHMQIFMEKKGKTPEPPRKVYTEADCTVHYPKDLRGTVLL